jgi:hypothetical protein
MDSYTIKIARTWGPQIGELLQEYPFVDHYTVYAFKPPYQRGPAKEDETFILSYAYAYNDCIGVNEPEFINKLNSINLRFYKEPCLFRGQNAYKILIMEPNVDLDTVLRYL